MKTSTKKIYLIIVTLFFIFAFMFSQHFLTYKKIIHTSNRFYTELGFSPLYNNIDKYYYMNFSFPQEINEFILFLDKYDKELSLILKDNNCKLINKGDTLIGIYNIGFDRIDNKGQIQYDLYDRVNYISSLFKKGDIMYMQYDVADTSQIIDKYYSQFLEEPYLIHQNKDTIQLDSTFYEKIKDIISSYYILKPIQEGKLPFRKHGERYKKIVYSINIKNKEFEFQKIYSNLINENFYSNIEQEIYSLIEQNEQDMFHEIEKIYLPLYLFEKEQYRYNDIN